MIAKFFTLFFIVLIITILAGAVIYGVNYFVQRKDMLHKLKKNKKNCYSILSQINKEHKNTISILQQELEQLKNIIDTTDATLAKPPANKELSNLTTTCQKQLKDLKEKIEEKIKKWNTYSSFRDNYDLISIQIQQKINEIQRKSSFLSNIDAENGEIIQENAQNIIDLLQNLAAEYNALYQASFSEFNFLILKDLENETDLYMDKANVFLTQLKYFSDNIKVFLTKLQRKTTFYITLEEEIEGKRSRERVGEIAVSYKTFNEGFEGKKYKQNIYISSKRFASEYILGIEVTCNEKAYPQWTQPINYEEFSSIFSQLSIDKSQFTEVDENCCPYELNLHELYELAWEKPENSFTVNAPIQLFAQININDIVNIIKGNYLNDEFKITFREIDEEKVSGRR